MKRKLEIQLEEIYLIEFEIEVCFYNLIFLFLKYIDFNFLILFDNFYFFKIYVIRVYLKNDGVSEVFIYRDVCKFLFKFVFLCILRSNMKRK